VQELEGVLGGLAVGPQQQHRAQPFVAGSDRQLVHDCLGHPGRACPEAIADVALEVAQPLLGA